MSFQIFPTPKTRRELFELFALYEPGGGVQSVTRRIDVADLSRAEIMKLVLNREPIRPPAPGPYNPRDFLTNQLKSAEFMKRGRILLANAFADKKRCIFVHVPKCAGSDLTRNLRERHPTLTENTFHTHGPAEIEAMFAEIRQFVIGTRYSDTIALTGHERLSWYLSHGVARPQDHLLTTVREPMSLVYSHVSYMLTVCELAREKPRRDATGWLRTIGMTRLADEITPAYMLEVGRRLLHSTDSTRPNRICDFLGDGTADGTLQQLAKTDIEITDTERYTDWRNARFPGNPERRINRSTPYFTPDLVSAEDRDFIHEITAQDRIVFERIRQTLAKTGQQSIRGRDLA